MPLRGLTVLELFFYLGDKYFERVFLKMRAGKWQEKSGELTETAVREFPGAAWWRGGGRELDGRKAGPWGFSPDTTSLSDCDNGKTTRQRKFLFSHFHIFKNNIYYQLFWVRLYLIPVIKYWVYFRELIHCYILHCSNL